MMEFEHRQTADDDEGMDLCKKKNRCCRVPPAQKEEGLLVHITDFFAHNS